jgi:hypothetical protein
MLLGDLKVVFAHDELDVFHAMNKVVLGPYHAAYYDGVFKRQNGVDDGISWAHD